MLDADRVKLSPVQLRDPEPSPELAPGEILVTKAAIWVGTATRAACLDQVQPAGRKLMNALDWARGVQLHGMSFQ